MPPASRIGEFAARLAERVHEAEVASAKRIRDAAKENVPVRTGDLQKAIHVREDDDGSVWVIAGGKVDGDRDVFYGHLVEFGTVTAPPQPFLVPAAEAERDRFANEVRDALRRDAP